VPSAFDEDLAERLEGGRQNVIAWRVWSTHRSDPQPSFADLE
jgi:hypothetical protein